MTVKELQEIFETTKSAWEGDNALQGLQILAKYSRNGICLCGADHDIIYGPDIESVLERGLTREDATALALLNWSITEFDSFSCFV